MCGDAGGTLFSCLSFFVIVFGNAYFGSLKHLKKQTHTHFVYSTFPIFSITKCWTSTMLWVNPLNPECLLYISSSLIRHMLYLKQQQLVLHFWVRLVKVIVAWLQKPCSINILFLQTCLNFLFLPVRLSSSPTSHYPMMMLPSGQAVPVLPGPGQMPSVINVRQTNSLNMLNVNCITKKLIHAVKTCVFIYLIWSPAGPTHEYGTQHSWNPRSSSGRQQQRL